MDAPRLFGSVPLIVRLLITILAGLLTLYGLVILFSGNRGSLIASIVCVIGGMYSYDTKSLLPIGVSVFLLFVLQALLRER